MGGSLAWQTESTSFPVEALMHVPVADKRAPLCGAIPGMWRTGAHAASYAAMGQHLTPSHVVHQPGACRESRDVQVQHVRDRERQVAAAHVHLAACARHILV